MKWRGIMDDQRKSLLIIHVDGNRVCGPITHIAFRIKKGKEANNSVDEDR